MPQRQLRINGFYISPEDRARVKAIIDELGWSKGTILKQMVHAFMHRHSAYYAEMAKLDFSHRGMEQTRYFQVLRDQKRWRDLLSPYTESTPNFDRTRSPLALMPAIVTDEGCLWNQSVLNLGARNFVLMRVALLVENEHLPQLIGKMVHRHLEDCWESHYNQQILSDMKMEF